jgi:hypothetical protein
MFSFKYELWKSKKLPWGMLGNRMSMVLPIAKMVPFWGGILTRSMVAERAGWRLLL